MSYQIIVPSKNPNNLKACLLAIRKCEPFARIIVIDDGIGAQMRDECEFFAPIKIIEGRRPFVFSRAINAGIVAAGSDDIVATNDDALLESPRGFELLAEACEEFPEIGCIGAVTNLTGQPLQQRSDSRPWLARRIARSSDPPDYSCRVGGESVIIPGYMKAPSMVRYLPHIAFVCVYIPRCTLELLANKAKADPRFTSGLDERYTAYGSDDLDFCMQVEVAGLKVAVHDGCFVDHSKLHSSFRSAPEAPGDIWPNHRLLRAKWGLGPNPQDPQQGGAR